MVVRDLAAELEARGERLQRQVAPQVRHTRPRTGSCAGHVCKSTSRRVSLLCFTGAAAAGGRAGGVVASPTHRQMRQQEACIARETAYPCELPLRSCSSRVGE